MVLDPLACAAQRQDGVAMRCATAEPEASSLLRNAGFCSASAGASF